MTKGTAKYHSNGEISLTDPQSGNKHNFATFKSVTDWADDYIEYLNRKWHALTKALKVF